MHEIDSLRASLCLGFPPKLIKPRHDTSIPSKMWTCHQASAYHSRHFTVADQLLEQLLRWWRAAHAKVPISSASYIQRDQNFPADPRGQLSPYIAVSGLPSLLLPVSMPKGACASLLCSSVSLQILFSQDVVLNALPSIPTGHKHCQVYG